MVSPGLVETLDVENGNLLWTFTPVLGDFYNVPAASDGVVYVSAFLDSVDAQSGGLSWQFEPERGSTSSDIAPVVHDGMVILGL